MPLILVTVITLIDKAQKKILARRGFYQLTLALQYASEILAKKTACPILD